MLLAVFAAAAYGPALNLPFIGDDYVFLDQTRDADFTELWSFTNADFGWYRPWSRELHFWLLQRVAGLHEVAYRVFGVALWVVALCLYAARPREVGRGDVLWVLVSASVLAAGTAIVTRGRPAAHARRGGGGGRALAGFAPPPPRGWDRAMRSL